MSIPRPHGLAIPTRAMGRLSHLRPMDGRYPGSMNRIPSEMDDEECWILGRCGWLIKSRRVIEDLFERQIHDDDTVFHKRDHGVCG